MFFKASSRIPVTLTSLLDVWKKPDNLGGSPKYVRGLRHRPGLLNVFCRSVCRGKIDDCLKGFFPSFSKERGGGREGRREREQLADTLMFYHNLNYFPWAKWRRLPL